MDSETVLKNAKKRLSALGLTYQQVGERIGYPPESARQSVLKSRSGYYIAVLIRRAEPVLPDEVRNVLGKYIDELDRKLDPNTPAPTDPKEPLDIDRLQDGIDDVQRRIDDVRDNLREGVDVDDK